MMKLFTLALLLATAHAQTVTTLPVPVVIPPCTLAAQIITITTPRNGGQVQIKLPARTCVGPNTTAPGQTVPMLYPKNYTFSCKGGVAQPDGSITGLNCTMTAVK